MIHRGSRGTIFRYHVAQSLIKRCGLLQWIVWLASLCHCSDWIVGPRNTLWGFFGLLQNLLYHNAIPSSRVEEEVEFCSWLYNGLSGARIEDKIWLICENKINARRIFVRCKVCWFIKNLWEVQRCDKVFQLLPSGVVSPPDHQSLEWALKSPAKNMA